MGCTTQIHGGPKIFFDKSKGQSWYVLTYSKGVFTKERSEINKIYGFVDHIKSFRGPHLARGPYVVDAWSNKWNQNMAAFTSAGKNTWWKTDENVN
jgi:hypothetical protein